MVAWITVLCVLAASLSALALGLDVGMISSTLVQPTFLSYFNNPSASQIGGIVASFSAGATFGAFGCTYVADPFGRLWGLRTGATIAIIGIALQAGAVALGMLIVGRLVCGFGAGLLTAVFPVYAAEIAPSNVRGALGGLQMLMIEAAIFVATAAGYGFGTSFTTDAQWRGPLAVQAIPLAILLPITFVLPETPRWLTQKGRIEESLAVLRRLHKDPLLVSQEHEEIVTQIEADKEGVEASWLHIWQHKPWRKRLLLSCALQFFSQFTGINCVQYYAATIYESLGFSTSDSLRLNLIYGALGFVFAIFWVFTIDKFHRITLLVIAEGGMCCALLVQAVLSGVYADKSTSNTNALNAQVAMFFVFNLFFIAIGMLSWLIPPEMCPMVIRARVNSASVSVNNIAGLIVAEISPIILGKIGFKYFFVFVALDIIGALTFWFFYPETGQVTLEHMDVQFGGPDPATKLDHAHVEYALDDQANNKPHHLAGKSGVAEDVEHCEDIGRS